MSYGKHLSYESALINRLARRTCTVMNVNVTYDVLSVTADSQAKNLTVVLEHVIQSPLSLIVSNLAAVQGVSPLTVTFNTVNVGSACSTACGASCPQQTTFVVSLPSTPTECSTENVQISFNLTADCDSASNDCVNNKDALPLNTTFVTLNVSYNYCPSNQETLFRVFTFELIQDNTLITEKGSVVDASAILGNLTLSQIETVNGSTFDTADIISLKLRESEPSTGSPYINALASANITTGTYNNNQIWLTFSYSPSFQSITTFLPNWVKGLYFEVTVNISFVFETQINKRVDNGDYGFVRLQKQTPSISQATPSHNFLAASQMFFLPKYTKPISNEKKLSEELDKKNEMELNLMEIQASLLKKQNNTLFLVVISLGITFIVASAALVVAVYMTWFQSESKEGNKSTPIIVGF